MKQSRQNFGRKRKPAGYIFLPGSKSCKAGGHLKLRSCLHDSVINCSPSIIKYTNKHELYRKCPPIRVKDTNMNEIQNSSCVINFMTLIPVLNIER